MYLSIIQRFTKRILILYGVWLLVEIPWIILNKPYFTEPFFNGMFDFIKDLLFATTFPGSWFLSALVVGVWVVFLINRVVKEEIGFGLLLFVSLYVIYGGFSDGLRGPLEWYSQNVREEVYLSFPISLVWVSMGQLMAKYKDKLMECSSPVMLGIVCIVLYLFNLMFPSYLWTYPIAFVLTWLALVVKLPERKYYRTMREASILVFLFHFTIAGKMSMFLNIIGSEAPVYMFLYYVIVLVLSLTFAFTVLWLENKRFRLLKYLH